MSGSSKEQYYTTGSVGKTRRGSPGETNSVFFQGQGGRTVLPPISSAFPTSRFPVPSTYNTPYTQPRSSPGRLYLNQTFYHSTQWPGNSSPPLPEPSFAASNYDLQQDRYNAQPSYQAYPSARTSPPLAQNPTDSRRLPPLSTASAAGGERWQPSPYQMSNYTTTSIRSPTASYPSPYNSYATSNYTYLPASDHLDMNPGLFDMEPTMGRSSSPGAGTAYRGQLTEGTFPQASPTSPNATPTTEEPTIKKKRKRADANQLKVLNEVYARTAFPSTEERNALAKQLDMSPRSVQIWFQNKRQSMRQTNRQSNSSGLSQQSYGVTSSGAPTSRTVAPTVEPAYMAPSDHGRGQLQSSSPLRRQEDAMPHPPKWPSRGF